MPKCMCICISFESWQYPCSRSLDCLRMTFITHILTYLIAISVVTEHKIAAQNMTSSTASPPTQPIDLTSQYSPVRSYAWLIVLIVLASLGILTLLGIQIYVLIKLFVSPTSDSTHPLKPWRSHWLGQTLLFGVFCSYATMFAFLPYRYESL